MTTTLQPPAPPATKSVPGRIRDRASRAGDRVALREKDFGIWQDITWGQYWDTIVTVGHGLLALGVKVGDRVAIQSENRPEWLITDMATVAVRAVTMGLYPTNPVAEVRYLLENSDSTILLAEDQEQVDKALAVVDQLPRLEKIIYIEPRGVRRRYTDPRLLYWDDFLDLGRQHRSAADGAVERCMAEATPDDIVALIYTSGTTGPPKGAMLSAANVEFAIRTLVEEGGFTDPPPTDTDVTLSYLPLSHVAERIFTTWFNASAGQLVHFAESIETVPQNLKEVQPTIFFGVPRIWEKIHATVEIRVASATRLKRWNYRFWMRVASRIGEKMVANGGRHTASTRLLSAIGNVFLFRALKDRIGLRKCRYAASGAAPIAPEVLKWFMGIGVPMHEVYGMTENTAVATANRPGSIKLGTVGEPYPTIELRIDDDTGEILTRHPGVFPGYWQNDEATRKTIDADGWLHTGDVGEWVDGTHVKITDRLKDIIITAGGKNISPSEIENSLKTSPFVKEAIVIGDRRPYLVALIGIELDTVGDWATRRRIPFTTYRDLSNKPEVVKLVQGVVEDTNTKFASVETIKKFRMLPKELDHEDGELTATQKVKRAAMAEMFGDLVEEMYRSRS
ncbi:MAG: AMP-binding protein [Nitriliruptorales bacterium]|nr:AMP-binding protein [Nitriliruptorales bacterium]